MIPRRPFGRTGHASTVTVFGAAALARVDQDRADRALELLLRHGVNHIDVAPRYGEAERRIGHLYPKATLPNGRRPTSSPGSGPARSPVPTPPAERRCRSYGRSG